MASLPSVSGERVVRANPHPPGSEKPSGEEKYRLRHGD